MSNLTIPANFPVALFDNFNQNSDKAQKNAEALWKNIYERKNSPGVNDSLNEDVNEIKKAYDELDNLKIQSELIAAQARKVDTSGQSTLGLQDAFVSKFNETSKFVMEKWVLPVIQDRVTQLLFDAERLSRQHDPQPYLFGKMKHEWKVLLRECDTAKETIKTQKFPIHPDALTALDILPGTLKSAQDVMLVMESFPEEMFVKLIDLVLGNYPNDSALQEQVKAEINELLSRVEDKFVDRLDYFVYLFSPDPKGGDGWGQQHRFDHFDVFQKAFGSAVWDHARHTLPPSIGTVKQIDPHTVVFDLMNKWTQPQKNDQISEMMARYKTKKAMGALNKDDKYTTIRPKTLRANQNPLPPPTDSTVSLQPKELCQAIYARTGRCTFQKMFYGKAVPFDRESWFTEQVREKPELEKIRDKLQVVCSQTDVELSVAQDYIRGCLNSLPEEDRFKIEEYVYSMSPDPWKGGERWGAYHAYDNPEVLLKAVKCMLGDVRH